MFSEDEKDKPAWALAASAELPPLLECGPNGIPSSEDLASFFEAVAGYEVLLNSPPESGGPPGISLLTGTQIQGPAGERAPFYIEDPGVKLATGQCDNVGRALKVDTWRTILRCCARAAKALRFSHGRGAIAWARAVVGPLIATQGATIPPSIAPRLFVPPRAPAIAAPLRQSSSVEAVPKRAIARRPTSSVAQALSKSRRAERPPVEVRTVPGYVPARPPRKRPWKGQTESSCWPAAEQAVAPWRHRNRAKRTKWSSGVPWTQVEFGQGTAPGGGNCHREALKGSGRSSKALRPHPPSTPPPGFSQHRSAHGSAESRSRGGGSYVRRMS